MFPYHATKPEVERTKPLLLKRRTKKQEVVYREAWHAGYEAGKRAGREEHRRDLAQMLGFELKEE